MDHLLYVCKIENVDEDDGKIVVQGNRCSNNYKTEFVCKEDDIFSNTIFDILAVL